MRTGKEMGTNLGEKWEGIEYGVRSPLGLAHRVVSSFHSVQLDEPSPWRSPTAGAFVFAPFVSGQRPQQTLPGAAVEPATKALGNDLRSAETGGQVAPGAAGAGQPENRRDAE
jgi:hypothetical protein